MNILHVIPGLTWENGGPSAVVKALASHQAQAGHQVSVLTTNLGERRGWQPVILPECVAVERLAVYGSDRLAYAPKFVATVRAHLRKCEVVHVHSVFTYPVHVALREALAADVPVVLRPCGQLHHYSLGRSRWRKRVYLALWGRLIRKACSAWHFTSEKEARESWPWDSSPRFAVPNGVDIDEFIVDRQLAQEHVCRLLPGLQRSPYVLFLGRLVSKKRPDLLVEAFLSGAPRQFKLVIAGPNEGNLWDIVCARYLQGAAAAERVVRVGTVTGRDKVMLLAGAALFTLPSEHENFANAALEALASGTPVLLSPYVDLADAVLGAKLGYTAGLDVAEWADRLASILSNLEGLEAMGCRARRWVSENYAWHQISREIVERYAWVTSGGGRLPRLSRSINRSFG
jgi:glycosyltransferase involved in cell wall biosynthesis